MGGFVASEPASGAGRDGRGDGWRHLVTSGAVSGTSGGAWRGLLRGYLAIAVFVALANVVNVLSVLHETGRSGHPLPVWEPITWEFTSWIGQLCACWMIYVALRLAPPGQAPWLRIVPVHGLTSLAVSGVHSGVMMLLRQAIYASVGQHYRTVTWGDMVYEYRKDVLAYVILGGMFWLLSRPAGAPRPGTAPAEVEVEPPATAPTTFDIVEGARILRVPVSQILAVRAAGNYVEFLLEDGRRPLMRVALGEMETSLAAHDFLRTHRSWIVNPSRLRSLEPVGSGDYRLELDGGAEAPLSRRFPAALERLRDGT